MNLSIDRTAEEEYFLDELRNKKACNKVEPLVKNMVDNVNHPPHYNSSSAMCDCGKNIECIEVTRHMSFNIGNAMKYLWRCELKGHMIEDLKKAMWYIKDEIRKRELSNSRP